MFKKDSLAGDFWHKNMYELEAFVLDEKAPFAVICPGGGYFMVATSVEGRPYAKKLNEMGYSAFVLRYHTRKKAVDFKPMDDLAKAITYILENADQLGVEKEAYTVWGSSAGGHLAASFGTKSLGYPKYGLPKPAALVLSYPVVSMGKEGHGDSRKYLLGKKPTDISLKLASIEHQIWSGYPPTYLWNSLEDKIVTPANSGLLAKALCKEGIKCEYNIYKNLPHGCGLAIGTEGEEWFEKAVKFIRSIA